MLYPAELRARLTNLANSERIRDRQSVFQGGDRIAGSPMLPEEALSGLIPPRLPGPLEFRPDDRVHSVNRGSGDRYLGIVTSIACLDSED